MISLISAIVGLKIISKGVNKKKVDQSLSEIIALSVIFASVVDLIYIGISFVVVKLYKFIVRKVFKIQQKEAVEPQQLPNNVISISDYLESKKAN